MWLNAFDDDLVALLARCSIIMSSPATAVNGVDGMEEKYKREFFSIAMSQRTSEIAFHKMLHYLPRLTVLDLNVEHSCSFNASLAEEVKKK